MKKHSLFFFVSFLKIYRSFLFFLSLKNPFFPFLFLFLTSVSREESTKKNKEKMGDCRREKTQTISFGVSGKEIKMFFIR